MKFTDTMEKTDWSAVEAALDWSVLDWSRFNLTDRRFRLVMYQAPNMRPPVIHEMMPDCERLIHSVAQKFSDQTSPHLQFEEMVGEGRLKLAEILDKGHEHIQPTRTNFFKFFKTSLQNHAKSRVQKYRFTEKRTGVKPPPRHERFAVPAPAPEEDDKQPPVHHKQVELSLDDTDLHLQVADTSDDAQEFNEVAEDYAALLSEPEQVVFKQLYQPNESARCHAWLDAHYLRMPGKFSVKIKHVHLAEGLEMSLELFEETVLRIKQKIAAYQAMTDVEQLEKARVSATIAQLKAVFGVQIPPTADDMLIRRLFTIAARDQHVKINQQVAEMLETVGAKVPRLHKDMISCYGVLYTAYDRRCQSCGLKKSCFVEASNLGLTKITLSPRLLGSRQQRSPVILPIMEGEETPGAASYDEAEILSYLDEYFTKFKRGDSIYYGHNTEDADRQVLLFCLGTQTTPLLVRFCSPSESLKKKLVAKGKSWFAPDNTPTSAITALLDQHAKDTLNG